MTSKEALKELRDTFEHDTFYIERKMLDVIEKDLEVLEILRKYVYFSHKSGCVRMKDIYKRTTNFDYEDLREWLENDNERENNAD